MSSSRHGNRRVPVSQLTTTHHLQVHGNPLDKQGAANRTRTCNPKVNAISRLKKGPRAPLLAAPTRQMHVTRGISGENKRRVWQPVSASQSGAGINEARSPAGGGARDGRPRGEARLGWARARVCAETRVCERMQMRLSRALPQSWQIKRARQRAPAHSLPPRRGRGRSTMLYKLLSSLPASTYGCF